MSNFHIGQVVADEEGFRGVVKYVGPVASAKKKETVWVGVEWVSKGRGKHDGAVPGKDGLPETRYFTCEMGQGSFVKPQFLRTGTTFSDALVERYQADVGDNRRVNEQSGNVETEILTGPRRGNGDVVTIEAVGMDMIRDKQRISNLREVSLASSAVMSAGEPGWIKENCPNIRELDLSENLIDSWAVVGTFLEQLPQLEQLVLARNTLVNGFPANPIEKLPGALRHGYNNLKVLVLNRTGTSFSQLQRLDVEGVIPALEELVLGDNELSSLDPFGAIKSDQVSYNKGTYAAWAKEQFKEVDRKGFTPESFANGFKNLRKIDISRNKLSSWSEVWRLSRLPNLRHINASDNPLETIFFDAPIQIPLDATPEDQPELDAERQQALDRFRELELNPDAPAHPQVAETKNEISEAKVIDIVMSNGIAVPITQQKERAKYTEARLFKGDGKVGGAQPFESLETLLLCRTRIVSWTSIDALNKFPKIQEIRLQDSPVIATAPNAGAARQNCIARVSSLTRLNGSEVSARERADAERLYLKRAAMERQSKQLNETEILALHPRFNDLVEIHGDPSEAAKRAAQSTEGGNLASNSAKVTIKSFDPRSCTIEPVSKRLPLTMTIHDLKVLCQRLFKVDTDLQVLFYSEKGKTFGHPTALDDDTMPIADFGVSEGGEIIMEARDPEKDAADAAKKASQEAQRMSAQEEQAKRDANIKRTELMQAKSNIIQP